MNALPKFVFSRTLKTSDLEQHADLRRDVPATVAKLKRETAKDIYLFGSADLASTLDFAMTLIDEFRIGVAPVLLGDGTPLFKQSSERDKLKLLDAKALSVGAVICATRRPERNLNR